MVSNILELDDMIIEISIGYVGIMKNELQYQLAITDTCVKKTLVLWGQLIPVSSTWNAVYELCLIRTIVCSGQILGCPD